MQPSGTLLATGSYDGIARVWTTKGEPKLTLAKHEGPIFSLQWNKSGSYLLSGSHDMTAIVWDGETGEVRQQTRAHSGMALVCDGDLAPSVDSHSHALCCACVCVQARSWALIGRTTRSLQRARSTARSLCTRSARSNLSPSSRATRYLTASSSLAHTCVWCRQRLTPPQDEVNAITWDPQGQLLASCSDDHTAKIWSLEQETAVHDIRDHTREIYSIKWSPTGPGTSNANRPLLLASASFDTTIRLWNPEVGRTVATLSKHMYVPDELAAPLALASGCG